MKNLTFIVMAVILTGCASDSKTHDPDIREIYSINCSGTDQNWEMCHQKAVEICKDNGYDIVTRNSDQDVIISVDNSNVSSSSTFSLTMMISCKK
jgi:hypothetical protein